MSNMGLSRLSTASYAEPDGTFQLLVTELVQHSSSIAQDPRISQLIHEYLYSPDATMA